MTSELKAEELVTKFKRFSLRSDARHEDVREKVNKNQAIQCALIAVEEILTTCTCNNFDYWKNARTHLTEM